MQQEHTVQRILGGMPPYNCTVLIYSIHLLFPTVLFSDESFMLCRNSVQWAGPSIFCCAELYPIFFLC